MQEDTYLYRGIRINQYESGDWLPINTTQVGAEMIYGVARYGMHLYGETRKNADLDHHMAVAKSQEDRSKIRRRVSTSRNRDVAVGFATDGGKREGVVLTLSTQACKKEGLTLQDSNEQMGEMGPTLGFPEQEEILIDNEGKEIPLTVVVKAEIIAKNGNTIKIIDNPHITM